MRTALYYGSDNGMHLKNAEKATFSKDKTAAALMCFLAVTSSLAIYQSDSTLAGDNVRLFIRILIYAAVAALGFIMLFIEKKFVKKHFLYALIPVLCCLFTLFNRYTEETESSIGILAAAILSIFMLARDDIKLTAYEYFKKYILIISFLGIIAYAAYILSVPLPHKTVFYYELGGADRYIDYTFSYLYKMGNRVRLCGLFNEPGYFGTFLGLILCADCLDMKKKENIVLFIAGFLTFSMAFYGIIFINYVLQAYKKPRKFFILIFLAMFYIFIFPYIHTGIEVIDIMINRLSFTNLQSGLNSRTSEYFNIIFNNWLTSDKLILGYGGGYVQNKLYGISAIGSSVKIYLVNYGIAGCLLLYAPLICCALSSAASNAYCIIYIICFVSSIIQRPNIFMMGYFLILFGGIQYQKKHLNLS